MNNPLEILKNIGLTEGKKSEIRQALSAHIDTGAQVSRWEEFVRGLAKVGTPATALAVMLVMLGGVSLAAENALPGDRLYPVKVNINEEFLSLTSVSPESEAINSSRIAERRIAELEQLAADGTLDEASAQKLADAVTEHAAEARKQIAAVSAEGETGSAASLEAELVSTLRTHSDILEDLSISHDGTRASTTATVALRLRALAEDKADDEVAVLRSSEASASSTPARTRGRLQPTDTEDTAEDGAASSTAALSDEQARDLLGRAADRLDAARDTFTASVNRGAITNDAVRISLEDTLTLAAEEIDSAVDAIDAGDYQVAEKSLRESLTLAHEATIIVTTREKLSASSDIDINELLDGNIDIASPSEEESETGTPTETQSDTDDEHGGQGGKLLPTNSDDIPADTQEEADETDDTATDTDDQNLTREAISPVVYDKIEDVLQRVSDTLASSTVEEDSSAPTNSGLLPARRNSDAEGENDTNTDTEETIDKTMEEGASEDSVR